MEQRFFNREIQTEFERTCEYLGALGTAIRAGEVPENPNEAVSRVDMIYTQGVDNLLHLKVTEKGEISEAIVLVSDAAMGVLDNFQGSQGNAAAEKLKARVLGTKKQHEIKKEAEVATH